MTEYSEYKYHVESLRAHGYAVMAFSPEELGPLRREDVEELMQRHGWNLIDAVANGDKYETTYRGL